MNDHQKIAAYLNQLLESDRVNVPGSEALNLVNCRGWLAAIAQGNLIVSEPQKMPEMENPDNAL